MVCTRYVISSGRKKRSANFQSVVPYWRVVTELVWADRPWSSWSWLQHSVTRPSSRGIYLVGQETPSLYRGVDERERGGGGRWIAVRAARGEERRWGRGEWDKDRSGGARQELKDEDMHINRETSTEMSDHR